MNCKPGDLAVIVRTPDYRYQEHIGRILRVIKVSINHGVVGWIFEAPWVEQLQAIVPGSGDVFVRDDCLRPLRDNPGDDETLTWSGKPEGVMA